MNNIRLFRKQYALIGTMMLVELVLLCSLQALLNQSQLQVQEAASLARLAVESDASIKADYYACLLMQSGQDSDSADAAQKFKKASSAIFATIQSLKIMVDFYPLESAELEQLWHLARRLQDILEASRIEMRQQFRGTDSGKRIDIVSSRALPAINELSDRISAFISRHQASLEASRQITELRQTQILSLTAVCIVLQLCLAFMSMSALSRSTASRVLTLTNNARRLAAGLTASSPLEGSDEIAQLDKVFRDMGTALTVALNKERAMMALMPVAFLTLSAEGRISLCNSRAEQMFNAKKNALVGVELCSLVDSPEPTSFEQLIEQSVGRTSELLFKRAHTGTFNGEFSLNRLGGNSNSVFICNILDVTERHELEKWKREFVNIVSHDLGTPLSSIQAFLRLLRLGSYGELDSQGRSTAARAFSECSRLIKLVSSLLTLGKMEAGKLQFSFSVCQIEALIEQSVNSLRPFADERDVLLIVGDQTPVSIEADEDKIIEVLVNLLSNAIKFSAQGETVTIESRTESQHLRIAVKDNGCGIPLSAQTAIFERFKQARASDAEIGTGLGLTICKLIVEGHGGQLGVISQEGKGSEFWVLLPLKAGVEPLPL